MWNFYNNCDYYKIIFLNEDNRIFYNSLNIYCYRNIFNYMKLTKIYKIIMYLKIINNHIIIYHKMYILYFS